jgi:Zn-dependent peptidase ImmA (M78 family)
MLLLSWLILHIPNGLGQVTKKKTIFERGFKTKAENLSIEYREKMGLKAWDPLDAFKLAEFLNIPVISPQDITSSQELINILCGSIGKSSGWSALVMNTSFNEKIIIHNSIHSAGRQQSNVMHEIAHIICGHEIPEKYKNMLLPSAMVFNDKKQEAEAGYLGAALQMSRACLHWALKRNYTHPQIADHFLASEEMVKFRINSSGVAFQRRHLSL